jgi:hypothetical protein
MSVSSNGYEYRGRMGVQYNAGAKALIARARKPMMRFVQTRLML